MTVGEDFNAHLDSEITHVCLCWRVVRADGVILGFTDHDEELTCDGTEFQPESGLSASEARQSLGLAVDAMDVQGVLSSDVITEADIANGLYDGALVEAFLVNWEVPTQFRLIRISTIGQITRNDGQFIAELENRASLTGHREGRTVTRLCPAELGDARCGMRLGDAQFSGAGNIEKQSGNALFVSGLDGFDAGWFSNGILTWTDGPFAGRRERISRHAFEGGRVKLDLWRARPITDVLGCEFDIVAGCDKRFSTCRGKFNNRLNFQGFPHVPGDDALYAYVADGAVFDGGALVP